MKKKTPSSKEIILAFIKHHLAGKQSIFLKNSSVQLKIPGFGIDVFGVARDPETYSRKFREAREGNFFKMHELEVVEATEHQFINTPDKVFKITPVKPIPKHTEYIQENLFRKINNAV
jgi:hypothetical protein